jgi:polyvinyl alcohol dehydrogenase (cytochrome)
MSLGHHAPGPGAVRLAIVIAIVLVILGGGLAAGIGYSRQHAHALQAQRGEAVFKAHCKSCHDPAVDEAPDRAALGLLSPQDIVATMTTGTMRPMAEGLTGPDQTAVAAYLGSRL